MCVCMCVIIHLVKHFKNEEINSATFNDSNLIIFWTIADCSRSRKRMPIIIFIMRMYSYDICLMATNKSYYFNHWSTSTRKSFFFYKFPSPPSRFYLTNPHRGPSVSRSTDRRLEYSYIWLVRQLKVLLYRYA